MVGSFAKKTRACVRPNYRLLFSVFTRETTEDFETYGVGSCRDESQDQDDERY